MDIYNMDITQPILRLYGTMAWDTEVLLDVRRQCWTSLKISVVHVYQWVDLRKVLGSAMEPPLSPHVV